MRGIKCLPWACLVALILLLGPAAAVSVAAGKPFVAPVTAEITRRFEPPSHRFAAGHRGIDYGVPVGTVVRASGAGTVSFAGRVADDGPAVTVQHVGGISTTYSYLSEVRVAKGDQVMQGQLIALSGQGHDGGPPLLHFGAKRNGQYIDPQILLSNFDDITDLISLQPLQAKDSSDFGLSAFRNIPKSEPPRFPVPGVEQELSRARGDGPPKNASTVSALPGGILNNAGGPELTERGNSALHQAAEHGIRQTQAPTDAAWWRSIPDELKERALKAKPNFLQGYKGATAAERDDLNRYLLDRRIEQLKAERDAAGPMAAMRHHAGILARGILSPTSVVSKFDRESAIDRKIRSAEALKKQLSAVANDSRRRLSKEDVYLLDFDIDFANGDGKAVVALGDPGTAEHIGVLVPGMNNAVGSIDRPLGDAAQLRAEVNRSVEADLDKKTSTIVWMGYDNPNGFQDAVNRDEATQAAPWLKTFVNDLRAAHVESPEAPHITVFGHSYGSTVTGIAALDGMKADDVVFLGSPGVGKWFVDSSDFPQKRIWAAGGKWTDWISWIAGGLGTDPSDESFGARKVPLGSDQQGHSDYYAIDSRGLANLARIMTGRFSEVH